MNLLRKFHLEFKIILIYLNFYPITRYLMSFILFNLKYLPIL